MNGFQHRENVDNYFLLLKTRLSAILRWIWHIFPIFLVDKQKRNLCLHFFCYHSGTEGWDWLKMILIFSNSLCTPTKEAGCLMIMCVQTPPPCLAVRLDFELGWSQWNLDKLTRAMLVLIMDKNDSSWYNNQIIIYLANYLKPYFIS